MTKTEYPTEIVTLPSHGNYYSEDNPLSSGEIEILYPSAKSEDILTTVNLIQRGVVIQKFLESLVVDDNINLGTMLIGDKNAIMVSARILAYGKEYSFDTNCNACGELNKVSFDLTTVKEKEIEIDSKSTNEFEFELPVSKQSVTFKLLTQADEHDIDATVKSLQKYSKGTGISSELTTRLKATLCSVNGDGKQTTINNFVDKMLSQDSFALRQHIRSVSPDINLKYDFECELCGYMEEVDVPMTAQFFWPATGV